MFEILKQVFSSWQVYVVTGAIVLYTFLVSHVAKSYHRPRTSKKINMNLFKKKKAQPVVSSAEGPEEIVSGSDSNDELGLEEA